jgi:SAM-dependent methyltransferase
MPAKDIHEANRISWNAATKQHNTHKGDQAAFLRDGGSTLFPEEINLLGDVRRKTLVHLQCNAGQDTLSIASKLGAVVTGVDISDEAVTFARQLAADSGIAGTFIRSDIYDWFAHNEARYDVAFSSYGALLWLSDLTTWARGVAAALNPGGRFVLVEFHPMISVLDGALSGDWKQAEDYMGGTLHSFETGVGDYVAEQGGALTTTGTVVQAAEPYINPHPAHEYSWGLADVIGALLTAGLALKTFNEYPYCNGFKPFPVMVEQPGRRMTLPDDMPLLPLMYGLVAQRLE